MQVISFANIKGGCGKSVGAVNTAGYLASMKKRTLLIDADYQANTSFFFNAKSKAMLERSSIYEALIGKKSLRDVIVKTDFPNLDLIPATNDLSIFNETSRDRYLLRSLIKRDKLEQDYDFIIIDSRPDVSDLLRNILIASNHVILPMFPDSDSIDGLALILKNLAELNESKKDVCGEGINLLGTIITNIDKSFATHTNLLPIIIGALGDKDIKIITEIPRSAGISSSQNAGRPIAFMPRLKGITIGKALEKIAKEALLSAKPQKGRPKSIPMFTEREKAKYTEALIRAEDMDGLSGELSL